MPKETFFKISEDKRLKLENVGIRLFSQFDFESVEVKQIVESADIPRGSFYAYFHNLEDYYSYIISSLQENRIKEIEQIADSFPENFFEFIISMYKNDLIKSNETSRLLLQHHYFRYIQTIKKGSLTGTIYNLQKRRNIITILLRIPIENDTNDVISIEEKEFIADLCMTVYLATYNQAIQENLSVREHMNLFEKRIRVIERGVRKC